MSPESRATDLARRLLCHEPRGHADMYGCFVVPPDPILIRDSLIGTRFVARVAGNVRSGSPSTSDVPGLVTEVTGSAHRTGVHTFVLDPADPLPEGFVLR